MKQMRHRVADTRRVTLLLIFVCLCYSFGLNGFGVDDVDRWVTWQSDSERFVVNRITFDGIAAPNAAYLAIAEHGGYQLYAPLGLIGSFATDGSLAMAYTSMIGGYAFALSDLVNGVGWIGLELLHGLNAVLLAAMVLAVFVLLPRISSRGFAWAWLAAMAFSPWITAAGRNLYWTPWLWLLPSIAAIGLSLSTRWLTRLLSVAALLSAFLLKYWATGYEIFTSVTLLAAAMPMLLIAFGHARGSALLRQMTNAVIVIATSVAAFGTIILVHAHLLTGNIASGLATLWTNTVLRRTWGAGEELSVLGVFWRYLYSQWSTPLFAFSVDREGSLFAIALGPTTFLLAFLVGLVITTVRLFNRDLLWKRDATLIGFGFLIAGSWFIAAKEHAYVHTHILFFLWYLFMIPSLLYIFTDYSWPPLRQRLGALGFYLTRLSNQVPPRTAPPNPLSRLTRRGKP